MGDQPRVLRGDHARTPRRLDRGETLQLDDIAGRCDVGDLPEPVDPLAETATVADLDHVPLAALDGGRHLDAAQPGRDDLRDDGPSLGGPG